MQQSVDGENHRSKMSGFSFGGNPNGLSPAPTNAAPSSGFPSLGQPVTTSTGSAPPASTATNNNSAAAPSTSFSASTGAQPPESSASAATGGFSFGDKTSSSQPSTSASTSVTNPPTTNALTQQFSMIVPDITEIFPHILILSEIRRLQDVENTVEIQRLTALIKKHNEILSKPLPPPIISPNADKRRQLQSNPNVQLYGRVAALTKGMLEEVFYLADTLYIPEEDAMALYAEASQTSSREWLQDIIQTKLESVPEAAIEHYFLQRRSMMQSILLLCQSRIDSNHESFSIVELTDGLLQAGLLTNLVTMIRKLSELISQLVSRQKEQTGKKNTRMLETWKGHLQQERQAAVESIFYLTYSTQCTEQEVVDLVDLVQEITNKQHLPNLDPVKDVPDAYHSTPAPQLWAVPFTQALPALQEKNTREWEQELVRETTELGDGAILPTVSVLVLAIVCALDRRQNLINRDTHAHNDFGVGNTLFENPDNATKSVLEDKLKTCGSGWNRKDIWGILSAAYALGLRPIKSVVNSPRAQPAAADGVKRTWISCLKAPYEHKSFTCLRLTLLPSIRRHKTVLDERCELYEFSMSVLSDFMSLYLDVLCASNYVPHSRANWEQTEKEQLLMKREEQESERSFHNAYKEGTYKALEDIRSEPNITERPDCIDDIIAFATALCNRGQEFAAYFWSRDGNNVAPSRALKHLEYRLREDRSLIPTHLSFLSALAMAEPSEVFNILNQEAAESDKTIMNWKTIFTTIRWYVREMSDSHTEVKPMQKDAPSDSLSTSYYYGVDDDGNRSTENSRSSARQANVRNQLKELDEGNTAIILSHLAVITKVADNYAAGRACLVDLKLSLEDAASKDESDSVLVVLFLLAIAPLTPHVRGSVFATIASLLSVDGEIKPNEKKLIQEAASEGWNLLELTQAVPVLLLDQYQRNGQSQNNPKMTFPPSSISAANTVASKAQLPADPKYGIVFEMEHVESHSGFYPSTEGLLQLLLSLVKVSGCPDKLGQEQRCRTGCAPYIEYVINFVLPKALDQLRFKTGVDSARLIARALAVVEAVLIRYTIPKTRDIPVEGVTKQQKSLDAVALLGICNVADAVKMISSENDILSYKNDFGSEQTNEALSEHQVVPRLKSPGFSILADILAASESGLLRVISNVLTRDGGSDGVNKIYGFADLQYRVTWARFGNTKPSVFSAKHKQERSPSLAPQSLLTQLLPPIDITVGLNDSLDPIHWRATGILTSLRILAAAAIREDSFIKASDGEATFVPALQFTAKYNMLQKKEIRLVRVKNSITGRNSTETRILPAISQYLKPICSAEIKDTALSGSALAVLFYSFIDSNVDGFLSALDAQSIHGELRFAAAVAERLAIACKRISCKVNTEIVNLLLLLVQSSLSNVLLGFPHKCVDGLRTDGVLPLKYQSKHTECLSILLDCLSNDNFLKSPDSSELASRIFQMIVCFSTSNNDDSSIGKIQADHLRMRLDEIDFWTNSSRKFLALREPDESYLLGSVTETHKLIEGAENVVRGAAWLCDGLAHYFAKNLQNINEDALSRKNQTLVSNLLDREYHLLDNAIDCLSIRNDANNRNFPTTLLSFQHTIEECMYKIDDKSEYRLINIIDLKKNISEVTDDALDEGVKWAKHYNQSTRWEHAISHLSSAIPNLIEACLEYSDWILKSGISSLLHNSGELNIARDKSLLRLLDKILSMLINHYHNRMDPPGWLSEPVLTNLSTEVLMLVERLLSSTHDRSEVPYSIIKKIGNATISSLQCSKSRSLTIVDEERAVLLGTSFCKLLKATKTDHQDSVHDMMKDIAKAFGNLSCRKVRHEKCSELEMRQSQVSVLSRSILCSLVGSFDIIGSEKTNEIVTSLASTLSTSSSQFTILQALVRLIPTRDSNICLLLETLSCCEGGASLLIKTGLLKALCDASEKFRKIEQTDALTVEYLYTSGWVTFFTSNLALVRSLLATFPDREKESESLNNSLLNLIISYKVIIYRVASSFPKYGECWLDIVQSLATSMAMKNNSRKKLQFGNSFLGSSETPSTWKEFGQIIACTGKLTEKIIQYPFPGWLQRSLPSSLKEEPDAADSWWDAIEQTDSLNSCNDEPHLLIPPTGSFTKDGVTANPWTRRKYEVCIAGAQVMDASLTILIQKSAEKNDLEFDTAALARGIIRLSDCSQAVTARLRDIESILTEGSNSMHIRGFDEHFNESTTIERDILEELCPLFSRIREKLLILSRSIYSNMKLINEEFCGGIASSVSPDMQKFRDFVLPAVEFVLPAVEYMGLARNGLLSPSRETEWSEFSILLLKRLKEELKEKV